MILETLKQYELLVAKLNNNVINDDMANNEQNELLKHIEEFTSSTRPRDPELKEIKKRSIS